MTNSHETGGWGPMAVIRNYAFLSYVNMKVANTSFENVVILKYLKIALTYTNTKKLRAD